MTSGIAVGDDARMARKRLTHSLTAATFALLAAALAFFTPRTASAAPRWIDRPITLPRLVFAGNVGLGVGHADPPGNGNGFTGPGLNLEGALGITDNVELGLRTGVRFNDDARLLQADQYGRTLWTETYGTRFDTAANPEFRVRWNFYSGSVAEVGLDARMYLPFEDGSRVGFMAGLPLAFHIADFMRIDTGVYLPVVFTDPRFVAFSVPGYFWFQTSSRFWLGPMTSLRFIDDGPAAGDSRTDLLLGFGMGYQVARAVDLKWQLYFPRINQDAGARTFGGGFGVEFRIGE